MRAHLHRGILRAATLESLLLRRAATGRDVAAAPRPGHTASTEDAKVHPCDEAFRDQLARLTAERAQHDAPVDPDDPATAAQIEHEVRARSISRNIADICRDLGVVAMMCTRAFWGTMADAIACHQDCAVAECLDDAPPEPKDSGQHENEPASDRMVSDGTWYPRQPSRLKIGARPFTPFRGRHPRGGPRHNVTTQHRHAAFAPAATGPPPLGRRCGPRRSSPPDFLKNIRSRYRGWNTASPAVPIRALLFRPGNDTACELSVSFSRPPRAAS